MISGIITGILLLSFLGIAAWAYSSRQRERFADAAQLPLRDENNQSSLTPLNSGCCCDGKERCR